MILTKNDLKRYLDQDRKMIGVKRQKPKLFGDEIWKFQIYLRKYEYYLNTGGVVKALLPLQIS